MSKQIKNDKDCRYYEHMVQDYLNEKLSDKDLLDFVNHTIHCQNCMEELTIGFMISEGLQSVEDDGEFSLPVELDRKMKATIMHIKRRKVLLYLLTALLICLVVAFTILVIWVIVK